MRRLHGPFTREDHGPRTRRRKQVKNLVASGSCSCGICTRRMEAGKEPFGWPETPCWARANPPGEDLPVMERPVYLCDRVGVGIQAGEAT